MSPAQLAAAQVQQLDQDSTDQDIYASLRSTAGVDKAHAVAIAKELGIRPDVLVQDRQYMTRPKPTGSLDSAVQLAEGYLAQLPEAGLFLHHDGKDFQTYDGRVWTTLCDNALKHNLQTFHLTRPDRNAEDNIMSVVRGAVAYLKLTQFRAAAHDKDAPPAINLQNGELWFLEKGDWEVRAHRASSGFHSITDYAFDDGEPKCPGFRNALRQICSTAEDPDEMVRHLEEVLAYGLQPFRDIPSIVVFSGSGANGKSAILKLWASLLPVSQVYWGSAGRLASDKFTLPALRDRRLFIDDDAKDGVRIDDGLLKSIAEDKPIETRQAYGRMPTSFRAKVLPVISMNGSPTLDDTSHGLARRLLVIPFTRQFTEAEMDRGLADRLIAEERGGILNFLLDANTRLRQRGWFEEPPECLAAKRAFLSSSNPLLAFVNDQCQHTPGFNTSTSELYAAYSAWCKREGHKLTYSQVAFTTRLKGMGLKVFKSGTNKVADFGLAVSEEAAQ